MRRSHSERGAAAVEFALVLPVLLMLVLGIVEFGRAYHVQTSLSLAAREGVRSMALTNNAATARAAARAAAPTVTLTDIGITLKNGTTIVPATCAVSATATTPTVHVVVTYPMPFMTRFFGTSLTLTGKAAMRCNG